MKISQLIQSPQNIRKEYPPELIEDLADSITLDGLLSRLILRPKGDKFEVLAGWRRKLALESILGPDTNLEDGWYIIKDVSNKEALRLSITENVQRLNLSSMELSIAAEAFRGESMTVKETAKALWTTEARVKRLLKMGEHLEDLPASAIQNLNTPDELDPAFTDLHVEALGKAGAFSMGGDVVRDVCEMIIANELPASKVASAVERLAPKEESQPVNEPVEGENGPPDETPMKDKYSGKLRMEGDQLVVESKRETIPIDLNYYKEFLLNPDQFSVYINASVNIKAIGDNPENA